MTEEKSSKKITESSPSVQIHLSILQGVIERMASNSTSSKTWCITVVSAILVVVADKGKPDYALLAFIPTVLFLALDSYYLALEKGFRKSYNKFVEKVHSSELTPKDLYSVSPSGNSKALLVEALKSFSVWGFYIVLAVLIWLSRSVVLN